MALTEYALRTLAANYTQQQLYNEIKACMLLAGFSAPIAEFTVSSTILEMIFQWTYNAETKGTAYLRIQVNPALSVFQNLTDGYSASGNTGTNYSSTTATCNTQVANPLTLLVIKNPEFRGVYLVTGSVNLNFVGLVRPESKVASWNEANWPFFFAMSSSFMQLRACATTVMPLMAILGQFQIGPNCQLTQLTTPNPTSNATDLFPLGLLMAFQTSTQCNIAGAFSSDIAYCHSSGKVIGDLSSDGKWIYAGGNLTFRIAN
jgi:hypothetical protein